MSKTFYDTDRSKYKKLDVSYIDFEANSNYKTHCPKCVSEGKDSSQDNLYVYADRGGAKCFGATCGFSIPSEGYMLENFENRHEASKAKGVFMSGHKDLEKFLEKRLSPERYKEVLDEKTSPKLLKSYRGLSPSVCEKFGVRWSYDNTTGDVKEMWFPSQVIEDGVLNTVGYKVRLKPKNFSAVGYVGKLSCFGGQVKNVEETLLIVGGEIDLISAYQMLDPVMKRYKRGINVVTSLLGETQTADFIKANFDWVVGHKKIILALDADDAGDAATKACIDILPKDKIYLANLRHKDPNEYLREGDGDLFCKDAYWEAKPYKNFGVVGSGDLFDAGVERLSQEKILFPAFLEDLSLCFTDKSLWLGEWVNWISSISTGKSTVVDAWMVDWAMNCPYRQAILSYESDRKSFGVKMMSLATSKAVLKIEGKDNRLRFAKENRDEILKLLKTPDGEHRFDFVDELPKSIEEVKDLINYLVNVRNVKVIWIDPVLDLLSVAKNKSEYDDLILFLDSIRMTKDVTIMCVLHTRKNLGGGGNGSTGGEIQEEDAYGGREVTAKATVNITAQRDKSSTDPIEKNTMTLSLRKNRSDGTTGSDVAKIFYRAKANKLYPFSVAEAHNFFRDDNLLSVEQIDAIGGDKGFDIGTIGHNKFNDDDCLTNSTSFD